MRFWTSDLHFQHIKAVEDFRRGIFNSLDEMNYGIVNNINNVVTENDTLFILGDVFFQPKKKLEENKNILSNIRCKDIRVAVGNHDSIGSLVAIGFKPENIFETKLIKIQSVEFVIGHFPYVDFINERDRKDRAWLPFPSMMINPSTGKPFNRLSGHVHESWRIRPHNLNVGVDTNNFKPLSENDIMDLFKATHGFTDEKAIDNLNKSVIR